MAWALVPEVNKNVRGLGPLLRLVLLLSLLLLLVTALVMAW
jgi:hypothetical protein